MTNENSSIIQLKKYWQHMSTMKLSITSCSDERYVQQQYHEQIGIKLCKEGGHKFGKGIRGSIPK